MDTDRGKVRDRDLDGDGDREKDRDGDGDGDRERRTGTGTGTVTGTGTGTGAERVTWIGTGTRTETGTWTGMETVTLTIKCEKQSKFRLNLSGYQTPCTNSLRGTRALLTNFRAVSDPSEEISVVSDNSLNKIPRGLIPL
jgi:hypothetical protein